MELYFNVVKPTDEGLNFLTQPIFYSKDCGCIKFSGIKGLINRTENTADEFLTNYINLMNFVMDPNRSVLNIKIKDSDGIYNVLSAYTKEFQKNGFFGVTVLKADEDELPIDRELELAEQVYEYISNQLRNDQLVETKNVNNLCKTYENNVTKILSDIRVKKGEQRGLESLITPSKNHMTKWDLFLVDPNSGLPVTDIYRYDSRKNESFNLEMTDELKTIHVGNTGKIRSLKDACKVIGELRHISTRLPQDKGYGFLFVEDLKINGQDYLLAIDVKNKEITDETYFNKLFGFERQAISDLMALIGSDFMLGQDLEDINEFKRNSEKMSLINNRMNSMITQTLSDYVELFNNKRKKQKV